MKPYRTENAIIAIVAFLGIAIAILTVMVGMHDIVMPYYYKYKAQSEPDKYSQCGVCKNWNSHKKMTWYNEKWICDDECLIKEVHITKGEQAHGIR